MRGNREDERKQRGQEETEKKLSLLPAGLRSGWVSSLGYCVGGDNRVVERVITQ